MKTFNSAPYYDDFSEDKKFHRILFRPGTAVQARELTQLQTILQNQVKQHSDHVFKEGAMVIPGQVSIDMNVGYVKLASWSAGGDITNLEGLNLVNADGLSAYVIKAIPVEGVDSATLFVKYNNSATSNNTTKVFSVNDVLTYGSYSATVAAADATGLGALTSIKRGVYYVKGNFVLCDDQTVVVSKYNSVPSARIGLTVTETVVTAEDDDTLLDNAQGSYNYAAPGADRYMIDLTLSTLALDSTADENFIELLQVEDGVIKQHVTKTEYSEIARTLARRTFDESGNYTVFPFNIDIREHRNNNRGQWITNTAYLIGDVVSNCGNTYVAKNNATSSATAPVHTSGTETDGAVKWEFTTIPFYNRGIYPATGTGTIGDSSKLAVGLESGKAYVQGYEIEKISTEYITVDKARDVVQVDNAVVSATVGNYILITNVNNMAPVDTFATINLYNRLIDTDGAAPSGGTLVGTARPRFVELHNGTIGSPAAIYKLGLFDVKMNDGYDFNRDVKSCYYNVSSDAQLSFTADVSPVTARLVGSATASASTTVTGTGTSFQTDLKANDYIVFGTNVVRRVVSISSQTEIKVDSSITIAGSTIDRISTEIKESEYSFLVFPLPYYAIQTVRDAEDDNNTAVYVYEKYAATSDGSGVVTISATPGTFASSADSDNFIVVNNDSTSGGAVLLPTSIVVVGSTATISLGGAYADTAVSVIAAVRKTTAEKTKTLQLASSTGISNWNADGSSTNGTVLLRTSATTVTSREILLGKADGYRLVSVKMNAGTFASPVQSGGANTYTVDITERYDFDNGQRASFYDVARIKLKSSFTVPTAPIEITFEYFAHSAGDYFTVNSYGDYAGTNSSDIAYEAIPSFNGVSLRDCIDFRPRMSDDSSGFTATGAVRSLVPKRGQDIITYYRYYLARKSKIAIDSDGNFFAVDGVSSLNPQDPLDTTLSMPLYMLTLEPYTFEANSTSVDIFTYDNKRYTMRDIGRLEKRIENLEYYTSLSLLEQQTESLDIIDGGGLTRFKNGFIVDGFTGHNTGDTASTDYLCSMDMEQGELRPFFSEFDVNLIEKNSINTERDAAKYKLYGDVITLRVLDNVPLVKQPYASRVENVNPFAVYTFLGSATLTPESDNWFETQRLPDIVNNGNGTFNSLSTIPETSGVLGSIWNGWQTQWSGRSTANTSSSAQSEWGNSISDNQSGTTVSRSTSATATSTGISVSITRTTTTVNDRVVSTSIIPFIRSRNILVQAKNLKPDTLFYPSFDGIDIGAYCTPASIVEYKPGTGSFNSTSNAGRNGEVAARRINGDAQVCLTRGDVIKGGTSNATAVVVGKGYDSVNNKYYLYVLNIIGTFTLGETIIGSDPAGIGTSATGTLNTITIANKGDDLIANFGGDLNLLFEIPNNNDIRFRTGTREFMLVDAGDKYASQAKAPYSAQGILEIRQRTITSVRRTVTFTSRDVNGPHDPLAQTFFVNSKGGAFLSKVDVFFASKGTRIPVILEIREVVNGYPGQNVLPFSSVSLKPEQVNLASSTVTLADGSVYPNYNTATTFTFPSPVYVEDGMEYAIVLRSDSNAYRVWISQVGDAIPGSTRTISEQPHLGSLFVSQNMSTWTPVQTQDLKFTLYRAKFETNTNANVEFVNGALPAQVLESNPFETRTGVAKVRVYQRDHGMPAGSSVIISNAVEADVNGIPSAEIYKTHTISDVDLDSYCITIATGSEPTSTGYAGGDNNRATRNIQFDVVQPNIQMQVFPDTNATFGIKTFTGQSVDSITQTAYIMPSAFTSVLVNENNQFFAPRMIASEVNEVAELGAGGKSATFNAVMSTTNDAVSPVIDAYRASLILINNKVNAPSETNLNIADLDYNIIVSNSAVVTIATNTVNTVDANTRLLFKAARVGKYLTVTGATSGSSTRLITAVADDGSSITLASDPDAVAGNITLTQREIFVDEIAPVGSSTYSKYVTKRINLANASNYLRIKYAAVIPREADVEVYYKVSPVGSTTSMSTVNYTKVDSDSVVVKSQVGSNQFIDMSHSVSDLTSFDAVQVKLVMKSTNSSAVPRIKDLRVVACA